MLELDGSFGSGGGQVLRTALALSALTGTDFRAINIRAKRPQPGLKAQHLFCINALKELCNARADNAVLGAEEISFMPGKIKPRTLSVDIGTAGSVTLLLQSLLIPAMFSSGKTRLKITGGTDTEWAMPYDYFANVFLPQIKQYVKNIEITLGRRGYFPKGGGRIDIEIRPRYSIDGFKDINEFRKFVRNDCSSIELLEQAKLFSIKGISHASLDLEKPEVAERQARAASHILKDYNAKIDTVYSPSLSTGSGIVLWATYDNKVVLGGDILGKRGVKAEIIGESAAKQLIQEMNSGAAADSHLADNLIPFIGLFGGKIKTSRITDHTITNMHIVEQFLGKCFETEENTIMNNQPM